MKILFADDDPFFIELAEESLSKWGYTVVTASDGNEAWEILQQEYSPRLVLLDWMMPGLNGIELCKKLKKRGNAPYLYIILLTCMGKKGDIVTGLEAGADDFVTKPFDSKELKIRIEVGARILKYEAELKEKNEQLAQYASQTKIRHDHISSVLNRLHLGAIIVEKGGAIIFLNHKAETLFGTSYNNALGVHWEKLLPLTIEEKEQIKRMQDQGTDKRNKLSFHIRNKMEMEFWVDFEIENDPQNPHRRIFLFYDVSEVRNLRNQLRENYHFHGMIGKSKPMMVLRKQIEDFSKLNWTVLIGGETGVGKELIARAIHFSSNRKDKIFIPVNTAGLSESLLTSQLFGHKRGAFTGAVEDIPGLFESAKGGTVFLDEIGDISPKVQVSLLRVLEERTIMRLGENKERKVDVRFITATAKNLNEEVSKGTFRSDLLYRIRSARINVPRLRERREDIPLLMEHFLSQTIAATGKNVLNVSDEAMRLILRYNWPGNIRELKSAINYAVIHCRASVINEEDLPPEIIDSHGVDKTLLQAKSFLEMDVEEAIKIAGGNRAQAAKLIGVSRSTLYRRLFKKSEK